MSDLGCWRQGEYIVVRYYGSEHMMTQADCEELLAHMRRIALEGATESLGEEYAELRRRPKPKFGQPSTTDRKVALAMMEALGLIANIRRHHGGTHEDRD